MMKNKIVSNFKVKKRAEKNFFSAWLANRRIFGIIALVFLLLILVPLAKNYSRQRLVADEIAGIQQEIADFEAKNKELRETIDYLQSDQSLEEQARLNMGLKMPGEKVAVIQSDAFGTVMPVELPKQSLPNWQKWWQHFMR
jgi:cell division protein FtsB